MASTFQQKLMLKGSEESIEYFTGILKEVKDKAGLSTATAIIESLENWGKCGTPAAKCEALQRQGRLRGLQLALVCSPELHLNVRNQLEMMKRDNKMGILMMRNKVTRDEWVMEALIVALELYLNTHKPDINLITRSDGMRCAIRELRGMSEVRIQDSSEPKIPTLQITPAKEENVRKPVTRDSSCPPTTGWRSRLLLDQEKENCKEKEPRNQEVMTQTVNHDKPPVANVSRENKERKIRRVRKTSERQRMRLDTINSESDFSISETSDKSASRRKKKEKRRIAAAANNNSPPPPKKSASKPSIPGLKFDIASINSPIRTSKERKESAAVVGKYIRVITPEAREMPGFEGKLAKWDRHRHGIDCDEVFPGIVLGNGATVKKKDYLKSIGVSHVLNAAEFRGVNVGEDYFGSTFQYKGLRVEDTPQTQICRHFMEVAEFLDSALSNNGKCFVNCVFGRSRSTTCVVVYLMLKYDWNALQALEHIRSFRPVEVNEGFIQQLADLDYKINWYKAKLQENSTSK